MLKAAREALADGQSRLVSVQPEDLLDELGVKPGESRDGINFAKNMCPSQGTMDIFVEPVLPRPSLVILGASPVALALAEQARPLGYHVTVAAPAADMPTARMPTSLVDGFGSSTSTRRGASSSSPRRARATRPRSRRRSASRPTTAPSSAAAARWRRCAQSSSPTASTPTAIDSVKAPAGLDLGAITPEEIALSILAEITVERRRGQRDASTSRG